MTQLQIITIIFLLGLFSYLVLIIFKKFGRELKEGILFICPILVFGLGFVLRLSEKKELIDLGYFLTGFAALFLSTLFAIFLFLGQLKYWKR